MHYYDTEKLSILTCTIMRQTHCHTKSAGLCQCLHALIQNSRDAMPTGHKNCQCCYATMLNRHNMMSMVACISSKQSRCHIYKKQHSVNAYMHSYWAAKLPSLQSVTKNQCLHASLQNSSAATLAGLVNDYMQFFKIASLPCWPG